MEFMACLSPNIHGFACILQRRIHVSMYPKDLSNFNKGQIVMSRQLGHSISKVVLWDVPARQWLIPTKSGARKESQ